jgi:hypothetical protein
MISAESTIISQVFNAMSVQTENGLAHSDSVLFLSIVLSSFLVTKRVCRLIVVYRQIPVFS